METFCDYIGVSYNTFAFGIHRLEIMLIKEKDIVEFVALDKM